MDKSASGKTEWMNVSLFFPPSTMWGGEGGSTKDLRTRERNTVVSSLLSFCIIYPRFGAEEAILREMPKGGYKTTVTTTAAAAMKPSWNRKKSLLSNVRIKNDKIWKRFCAWMLYSSQAIWKEKKKKKKDCGLPAPCRPSPPPSPTPSQEDLAGKLEFHVLLAETGATFPSSPHPWKSSAWRFWNYASTRQ